MGTLARPRARDDEHSTYAISQIGISASPSFVYYIQRIHVHYRSLNISGGVRNYEYVDNDFENFFYSDVIVMR